LTRFFGTLSKGGGGCSRARSGGCKSSTWPFWKECLLRGGEVKQVWGVGENTCSHEIGGIHGKKRAQGPRMKKEGKKKKRKGHVVCRQGRGHLSTRSARGREGRPFRLPRKGGKNHEEMSRGGKDPRSSGNSDVFFQRSECLQYLQEEGKGGERSKSWLQPPVFRGQV